ncbi:peptidyl-prolyl cis-trans fkbp-type domain-containing protein [Cystoisospora suis]|uniref:peptidylprolyl isomerase n=1 Tax=Cystoisospora suis TaxID=483139 RepID=A0A2C6KL15_9APIC|nr:peptidyl-prolyl cis-trans fkbp-type domain-containing protein [Cystoisospora suis]
MGMSQPSGRISVQGSPLLRCFSFRSFPLLRLAAAPPGAARFTSPPTKGETATRRAVHDGSAYRVNWREEQPQTPGKTRPVRSSTSAARAYSLHTTAFSRIVGSCVLDRPIAPPFFVPRAQEWSSRLPSLGISSFRDGKESRVVHRVLSQSSGRSLSTFCLVSTSQTPIPPFKAIILNEGTPLAPQTERRHANFSTTDSAGRLGEGKQQRPDRLSELCQRFVPVFFVSLGLSCLILDGNPLTSQTEIRFAGDHSETECLQESSNSLSAEDTGQSNSVEDVTLVKHESPAAPSTFLSPEKQRNGFSRDCRHVSISRFSGGGPGGERQLLALCRKAAQNQEGPSGDDCEQKENKEKLNKKEETPASPLVPFALSKEKYMQKKFSKASDYRRTSSGMRICDKEEGRGDLVVQPGDVVWLQYEGRRASDDQLFESTSCARLPTLLSNLLALFGWKTGAIAGIDGRYVRVKIRKRSDDSSSANEKQPAAASTSEPLSQSTNNGHPLKTPDSCRGSGLSTREPVDLASRGANNTRKPDKTGNTAGSEKGEEGEPRDPTEVFHPIIPALEEGVQGMRVGGLRELIVPPHLAYPSICDEYPTYWRRCTQTPFPWTDRRWRATEASQQAGLHAPSAAV